MNAFTTTPRKDLTEQQRAKFFFERGGHCEECGIKIRAGSRWEVDSGEIDHDESLECGGTNDRNNMRLLCHPCHGAKTSKDRAKAAKTRRVATRGIVPEAHRKKSKLSKPIGMDYSWTLRRYLPKQPAGEE